MTETKNIHEKTLPQAIVSELGDLAVIDVRNPGVVRVSAEQANTATRAAQIAEGFDVNDLRVQQGPAGYEVATWNDGTHRVSAGVRDGVVERLRIDIPASDQKAA